MARFYGVRAIDQQGSVSAPTTATCGITIAFGTAPIHQVGGTPNEIIAAESYDEAVAALGYSDDWEKYTLCEVMENHLKNYGVAPVLFVNVLDPEKHKETVADKSEIITNGQVILTGDAIADTITVKNGETTYVSGEDYDVMYEDGACIIEILPDGAISKESLSAVTVGYEQVSFELSDLKDDVIGGYDVKTNKSTGLELMDMAYFSSLVLPDILICPGFSQMSEVAAVMAAKTTFSTVFRATCACDIDTATATTYAQAAAVKQGDINYQNKRQIVLWPMAKRGDKMYHLSTQYAAAQCRVDADNDGVPSRVASNTALEIDGVCLADGTEILMNLDQANYLRESGMVTALNFVDGFKAWGAYTACWPANTDVKDNLINMTRMFGFVANSAILAYWNRVDNTLTPRYAEAITDDINIWLNSLTGTGDLYGARVELRAAENPLSDLSAGIVRLHIYMAPPFLTQEIDFLLEFDVEYAAETLADMTTTA